MPFARLAKWEAIVLGFVLLCCLLLIEFLIGHLKVIQLPSDFVNMNGRKYMAAHGSYLPFTLTRDMVFRHQGPEFDVEYRTNKFGYRGSEPKSILRRFGLQARALVSQPRPTLDR
jgi:hypothetical protein